MTRRSAILIGLVLVIAVGCGGGPSAGVNKPQRNDAILHFDTPVKNAEVYVDGRLIRRVRELRGGLALSPGSYRIEIRHDHYHSLYLELTVEKRERRTIPVKLAPILP